MAETPKSILRMAQIVELTKLSRATIHRMSRNGTFTPRKIQLTQRTVGYFASDVEAWLDSRAQAK